MGSPKGVKPLKKVLSLEDLLPIRERLKAEGKTLVLTNGRIEVRDYVIIFEDRTAIWR